MEASDCTKVLKISEVSPPSSHRDTDDSDSSYGELARDSARNIDLKILEAQIEGEERSAKIRAGAEARRRRLNDSRGSGKPKATNVSKSNRICSSDGANENKSKEPDSDRVQAGEGRSFKKNRKKTKSAGDESSKPANPQNQPANSTEQPVKSKRNKGNKKKFKNTLPTQPEEIIVEEVSSKLKNVTVQEFDVDSSGASDVDDGKARDAKFRVRRLNAKKESFSDEESSSDKDAPIGFRPSAEKSAAAQRRKRSGYLKKRHSNFKPPSMTDKVIDLNSLAFLGTINESCPSVEDTVIIESSVCSGNKAKTKKRNNKRIANKDNKPSNINDESSKSKDHDSSRLTSGKKQSKNKDETAKSKDYNSSRLVSGKNQSNNKDETSKSKDYNSSRLGSGKKQSNNKDETAKSKNYDSSRLVSGKKQSNNKDETSKSKDYDSSRLVSGKKLPYNHDEASKNKDYDSLQSILTQLNVDDERKASSVASSQSKRDGTRECKNVKKSNVPNFDSPMQFNKCCDDVNCAVLNNRCSNKLGYFNRVEINNDASTDDIKGVEKCIKKETPVDLICKNLSPQDYILGDDLTKDSTTSTETFCSKRDIVADMASSDDDVDFATMVNSLSARKGPLVEFNSVPHDGDDSSDLDDEFNAQLSRF